MSILFLVDVKFLNGSLISALEEEKILRQLYVPKKVHGTCADLAKYYNS